MVNVDLGFLDTRTVRVNVTIPAGTLEEIDKAAKGRGLTRSAFLVGAARREMARGRGRSRPLVLRVRGGGRRGGRPAAPTRIHPCPEWSL